MPLPTFLIVGERKCGTTSLYEWMRVHPDVYLHPHQDMNYFIEDEIVGTRKWIGGEVDAQRWEQTHSIQGYSEFFRDGEGCRAIGEKSADLLFWRLAHERIARYLPNCRFIVILRNPIERAWSHYWNEVGKGRETFRFEDALAAEEERARNSAYARNHLSYLARGFYDESLKAFFQHIPATRVLVVTIEQCRLQPREKLGEIYKFISVDPHMGLELAGTRHNQNWTMIQRSWATFPVIKPIERVYDRVIEASIVRLTSDTTRRRTTRKYTKLPFRRPASSIRMPGEVRSYLSEIYSPHIKKMGSMLGREFPEWQR